jgi:hypothetical protein
MPGGFDDGLNFGGGTPPVEPPPLPPSTATPPAHTPDDDLDFAGTPQPPDVPPDPNGENWRGQPGPVGPTGPQGPPGADGEDGAGGAVVLPTPPIADPGALWWDSTGGQLYVRYDDGNGPPQWVAASSKAGGSSIPDAPNDGTIYGRGGTILGWSGVLPLTGGTMLGALTLAANATANLQAVSLQQMQAAISAIPAGGVISFNTRTGAITLTNADVVTVLPPSSTTPVMDGTAAIGSVNTWAKADHVHPTDTSRYAASNPAGYQTAAQVTAAIDAKLVIAATAPAVVHGALWWDSTGGQLYIGYNDGNSLAWIVASSTPR